MMLPHLEALGWKPTVLAVDPEFVDGPVEEDLLLTFPADTEVVRVSAVSRRTARRFGVGSLSMRAGRSLRSEGDRILSSRKFDLVFFSTTEFGVVPLGRRWKRRFGVPFVVDIQDPWVNTHYRETGRRPPGGWFKHTVTQAIALMDEGRTLEDAGAIITVSPGYPDTLTRRHPRLSREKFAVIPFAGSRADFTAVKNREQIQRLFDPADGRMHWLYAGTAPPGIRNSIAGFLIALKRAISEGIIAEDSVRIHFVGTDYAPAHLATERVAPIAREFGMDHLISEHPARIPYLATLRCMLDAHALLLFGWDDPGYTASKVYPSILAERPLLAILHEESSANGVLRATRAGITVPFATGEDDERLASRIYESWFASLAFDTVPRTSWEEFEPFTAETMSGRVTKVFHSVAP